MKVYNIDARRQCYKTQYFRFTDILRKYGENVRNTEILIRVAVLRLFYENTEKNVRNTEIRSL